MAKSNQSKSLVSGVILIDKPIGPTSQQVVSKVKFLLQSSVHNSKKAGHTGTLDPMATGLLPVCLGEATKFSHYQLEADKSYQAKVELGSQTDTGDAQGQIIATQPVAAFTQLQLNHLATLFTGNLSQIPPMYSALKKDGKKLYEYAREGIEVARPARPITIHHLSIVPGPSANEILLTVTCSKGTYIRVLGEDIAAALGTLGHLTALRRIQVGSFKVTDAITLKDLESLSHVQRLGCLLPIDACIKDLPFIVVTQQQCDRLHLGQRLNVSHLINTALQIAFADSKNVDQTIDVRLFNESDEFLGLGTLEPTGRLQPRKMIQRK